MILKIPKKGAPSYRFAITAFTQVVALFCSFSALQHVDFPSQTLAKSCKPIPIIVIGYLFYGKRYPWKKLIVVAAIVFGISIFILDQEVEGAKYNQTFSLIGLSLLFASLLMDGFTGAIQDNLRKGYNTSPYRTMFYSNVWSTIIVFGAVIATGEFIKALSFIYRFPEVLISIIILSVSNPIGQFFIYAMIHRFGSLTNSTITTTRKFFSILFSVFWFGHPLSILQWISVAIVFASLAVDVFQSKSRPSKQKDEKKAD